MWPDLSSGSLLTRRLLRSTERFSPTRPWEKTPVDIKGRPMWERTTEIPQRTLKVTMGQFSCRHKPDSGSDDIGIPVQCQSDRSSRKLSPLVSIRGQTTERSM